jgi:aminoglycoside phosphotransferase (APT) family kinase protein
MLRSEVMTMSLIRRNTSIPIPEIYDYCETSSNETGIPSVLMEFVEGFPVSEIWFRRHGANPKIGTANAHSGYHCGCNVTA